MHVDVGIVGAGPAGLASCAALLQKGFTVALFDRPEVGNGAAVTLWPNARLALEMAQVPMLWSGEVHTLTGLRMAKWDGSNLYQTSPELLVKQCGYPGYVATRVHLREALYEHCSTAEHFGEIINLSRARGRWHCQSDEGQVEARVLVAADGMQSLVRRQLWPAYRLKHHPMTVIRGVSDHAVEGHIAEMRLGRGTQLGIFPMGRRTYWFVSAHTKSIPPITRDDPISCSRFVQELVRECGQGAMQLVAQTPPTDLLATSVTDGPVVTGGVPYATFVGDAGHPIAPTMGQGTGLAFEDAAVLAAELNRSGLVDTALRAFESRRRRRWSRIMNSSRAAVRNGLAQSRLTCALRAMAIRAIPPNVMGRQLARDLAYQA